MWVSDTKRSTLNQAEFESAAAKRFGSGWAWLGVAPDGKLVISSTPNQVPAFHFSLDVCRFTLDVCRVTVYGARYTVYDVR